MDRVQWLEDRKKSVGASESAAVLGVSPWSSGLEVWANKVGLIDGFEPTEAMQWGNILEPVILAEFQERTGLEVQRHDQSVTIGHPLGLPMACTPDGYIGQEDLIEVKTTSAFAAEDWLDGVPLWYQVQCQHQLGITGRKRVHVAALIGGQKLLFGEPYIVERSQDFIDRLEETIERWWATYVITKQEPPAAWDGTAARALEKLHPKDNGAEVLLSDLFTELDERLIAIKAEQALLKKERERIESRIKAAIGAATYGRLECGAAYKWATQESKGYTVEPKMFRVLRRVK